MGTDAMNNEPSFVQLNGSGLFIRCQTMDQGIERM